MVLIHGYGRRSFQTSSKWIAERLAQGQKRFPTSKATLPKFLGTSSLVIAAGYRPLSQQSTETLSRTLSGIARQGRISTTDSNRMCRQRRG
ncbi:hypothetical protein FTI75_00710 [Burkholderia pseudomallei]|nr:hypothetical protein FTI75_00710 [Burkholderia pseudomallei]